MHDECDDDDENDEPAEAGPESIGSEHVYLPFFLRPAADIWLIFFAPYFFRPIAAATASGFRTFPDFPILLLSCLNLSPLPSFGFLLVAKPHLLDQHDDEAKHTENRDDDDCS
jgi:hypothetical protein